MQPNWHLWRQCGMLQCCTTHPTWYGMDIRYEVQRYLRWPEPWLMTHSWPSVFPQGESTPGFLSIGISGPLRGPQKCLFLFSEGLNLTGTLISGKFGDAFLGLFEIFWHWWAFDGHPLRIELALDAHYLSIERALLEFTLEAHSLSIQ